MKKIIIRTLCILFVFSITFGIISCSENSVNSVNSDETEFTESYILNTNSKKIHKTTCGTGDNIAPRNRKEYKGNIGRLLDKGYTVCGNCFK